LSGAERRIEDDAGAAIAPRDLHSPQQVSVVDRRSPRQRVDQLGGTVEHVLAVVQDQQHAPVADRLDQSVQSTVDVPARSATPSAEATTAPPAACGVPKVGQ
jgi:hypothetical protein